MPSLHTRWPLFGALAGGLLVLAGLWAFVLSNPEGEAVPASGGRFVEGVTRAPARINPLFAYANPTDVDLSSLIFSGLVRLGPDGTPQPDLAERWEITGNGTTYVFHLRDGIAWQDDALTPVDARDVEFTYRAIADPSFRGDPALAALMEGVIVSARDSRTVEFQLEQAYAPFLAHLTVGILPRHLLQDLDANAMFNAEFNLRPIGSGPYRFRGSTGQGVVLDSNPSYHFGPPRVETVEFRTYADTAALTEALRNGQADGGLFPPEAPGDQIDALQDDGALQVHDLAPTSLVAVYLDTRWPLLSDPVVRTALAQSTNGQQAAAEAIGRGAPPTVGIAASTWADPGISLPSFDPGEAARELEDAGWARGSDGVRAKGGERLELTLSTSNEPYRVAVAEAVARQWRALGASVRVQPIDAATYIDEHLLGRQFQAAVVELDPGPDPDPYPFWHSTQIAAPGRNLSGYSTPQLDDVLERARQTTDVARRTELYRLFAATITADVPWVPLYTPVEVYALNHRVRGFNPSPLFTRASRFSNIQDWYVRTRVE